MFISYLHTLRGELALWPHRRLIDRISFEVLNNILARNPLWRRGHLILSRRALQEKRYDVAYAEYYALMTLSTTEQQRAEAEFLGAQVLVRSGEFEKALTKLEILKDRLPPLAIVEEQVAALVALSRHEEAMLRINALPEHLQTPELRAIKSFMLRRGDGTLYR